MSSFVLLLCFWINGSIVKHSIISPAMTLSKCLETKNNQNVIFSYKEIFPDKDVILICQEIK